MPKPYVCLAFIQAQTTHTAKQGGKGIETKFERFSTDFQDPRYLRGKGPVGQLVRSKRLLASMRCNVPTYEKPLCCKLQTTPFTNCQKCVRNFWQGCSRISTPQLMIQTLF